MRVEEKRRCSVSARDFLMQLCTSSPIACTELRRSDTSPLSSFLSVTGLLFLLLVGRKFPCDNAGHGNSSLFKLIKPWVFKVPQPLIITCQIELPCTNVVFIF